MNKIINTSNKNIYIQPSICRVDIDNHISMELTSLPDPGDEPLVQIHFNQTTNNPFRINIS